MSQLVKIFLGIAALGLIVSVIYGCLLINKFSEKQANLDQATQAKAVAQKDAATQKQKAEEAAKAQADAESKLAATKPQIDELNTKLSAATQKADEAQKAVDQAKADAAKAQADLDALNKQIPAGTTIPDLIAAKDKAEKDLASSQAEQKIMADNLQKAQEQVDQLKLDINASKIGKIPPGVSGKVTFVNKTWNFVVLNVGLSNGVVPNGELIIYRKNTFLGKVRITTADTNSSVADILPDVKGDIQVGDYVLN